MKEKEQQSNVSLLACSPATVCTIACLQRWLVTLAEPSVYTKHVLALIASMQSILPYNSLLLTP